MNTSHMTMILRAALAATSLAVAGFASAATTVNLTAQRATATLPDGRSVPMWQFCGTTGPNADTTASIGTATGPGTACGAWAPGPTITVPAGDTLTINLTNTLPVPTSIVVLGQLGGGLGTPQTMPSPAHPGQDFTTFVGNASASPRFTPPTQGQRVKSFGSEIAGATTTGPGSGALTWANLKPGTYIYETGTLPSLQAPMGLYGLLIVTTAPVPVGSSTAFIAGNAYPNSGAVCTSAPSTGPWPAPCYDSDAALLFSEIDPVQNAQVDAAAQAGTSMVANLRWDDPNCATAGTNPAGGNVCFPAAVNYTPIYFLINGQGFDATNPTLSTYAVGANYSSGNVLLRLANAGLRTHIPAVVGLTMSLVGEDGNLAPGKPKVQSEALLTAGKTYDAIVTPAAASGAFTANSFAVFDRQGSLSTANQRDGGMQAYLLVGAGAAAPAAVAAQANPDFYAVAIGGSINGKVTANDYGIRSVVVNGAGPSAGTLNLGPDGSFIYTSTGTTSTVDTFQYCGNGAMSGPTCAWVTLTIGNGTTTTTANASCPNGIALASASFNSNVASVFKASSPGVLAGACDPGNYALTVASSANSSCGSLTVNTDGSFTATSGGAASCQFTYTAKDSQGLISAPATATVTFATGSGLALSVVDAKTAVAIADYRWVIQEDLTFHHDTTATPSVSTRTLGTSFHRSHNPVVASGCVGPISCGTGQSVRGVAVNDAQALALQTLPGDVALDPSKRYYISVLPADANQAIANAPTPHIMGGAEVAPGQLAATIALQSGPLVPAQLSVYVYEDNSPTNGQNELSEPPLGGFNVILWDPAGRTGDPAGQQTYDAFNMPMTNALLGSPGCPDDQNTATNGTGTSGAGNLVGAIYTCPNAPPGYTGDPTVYALAGHALIKNITPARYDVIIHPGAARGNETWWQTETLEGTAAQDAFTGINEPRYFQEFGPPGFHTTVGFVNPAHVAASAQASNAVACPSCAITTGATITGQITSQHMSRPSNVTLWDSQSYALLSSTVCRVVLNSQAGDGPAVAAAECNPDGSFTLTNILPGDYEVQIFDKWLDQIIQAQAVTVPPPPVTTVALGNIPVLSWFTQFDQNIKLDDGSCDLLTGAALIACDNALPGIPNVVQSTRFRNGAMSNQTATDVNGNGILVEQFPLFNWYVTEADQTRFKQKRVDIVVDGGGKPDATGPGAALWSSTYADGTSSIRSEVPGSASYGLQSFISQRNQVNYIKAPYVAGENGGIQGLVVLSTTRPFDDQRMNVQTIWEPLVPRVNVNLYKRTKNADGTVTLALVDQTRTSSFDDFVNTVHGLNGSTEVLNSAGQPGWIVGPDQVLRDPANGSPAPVGTTAGLQINLQCPGQLPGTTAAPPWDLTTVDPFTSFTLLGDRYRCYDGWHNWNQVQKAPYDGRYVFPSDAYKAAHPLTAAQIAAGQTLVSLPPGDYVVEAQTPQGYEIVKEEDKNILIGDAFVAPAVQQFGPLASIFILPDQATLNNANPNNPNTGDPGFQSNPTSNLGVLESQAVGAPTFAECVGALHRVPDYLSIFPQAAQVAPFAGMDRALCDKKLVKLGDQMQAGTNFFLFTATPVAANATGIILDDTTSEYNAYSPDFGEKASVPFIPVSTKDFAGHEVSRTYSDQWGAYNLMLPSSWLVNPPTPSGYGPNMLVNCINDPGPIPEVVNGVATGRMITDPAYNPSYSNFCYTNPFMPGQATYLDTPVVPIASFAAGYLPPDCAYPNATPAIARVDSSNGFGPYLASANGTSTLTLTALGDQTVPNPLYAGPFALTGPTSQRTITRHYGFGLQGTHGKVTVNGVAQTVTAWTDTSITVTVPTGTTTGQLVVTADNGVSSIDTVTVTIEAKAPTRVSAGQTIQAAVDAANPGDLILVDAGIYNELVIMWKPVRLQGVGAASVIINAAKYPTSKLAVWRPMINSLFSINANTGNVDGTPQIDPLPTQEITGGVILLEPSVLGSEEGAGITVLAKNLPAGQCANGGLSTYGQDITQSNFLCAPSRIDGISVTGGDAGGGIYVNGWAHGLEISNNRVYGNAGAYNGGVRIGVPALEEETFPLNADGSVATAGGRIAGFGYDVNVKIHNNAITKNGTVEAPVGGGGAGAGLSICSGSDGYQVDANWVCGNFGSSDGGGIGHVGFSQGGSITRNTVLFNQSFQQSGPTHGGGIVVTGEPAIAGTLTLGSGDVVIDANLVRGNFAEGGHGGGIRLQQVNGQDIAATVNSQGNAVPGKWHTVTVTNNMVVNNVAGYSGGGISLADALSVNVTSNTVAANDSAGIAGSVLSVNGGAPVALPSETPGTAGVGKPSPAGISSEPTSAQLLAAFSGSSAGGQRTANAASQPQTFENNIVWHNRSFFYSGDGRLCASNGSANATPATCVVLADQASTGECVSGAAFWDLGVVGDTSPTPGAFKLNPSYSVLSSLAGYTGTGLTATDPAMADLYCNGARTPPELSAAINPPSPKNLQVNATVDEGNNYVNLRYGPLYLNTVDTNTGLTSTAKGDYHLTAASTSALDTGTSLAALGAPYTHDFDGQSRPQGAGFDIGADELMGPQADLAITKTDGKTTAAAGSTVTYTIVVTNNGPTAVTGATVNDPIPTVLTGTSGTTRVSLTGVTWSCTVAVGGSCATASGSGAITNAQVNLANGASATFTFIGTLPVNARVNSSLTNTATVTAPVGVSDPNLANNTATDTDTITPPLADLSITKTASVASVQRGGAVGYTITVTNNGPNPVTGALVSDTRPTALTGTSWNWSCTPVVSCGGSSGSNTNQTGNISKTLATLASGASVTFTVNATVSTNTTNAPAGSFTNTATVTAPTTVTDPSLANNTATVSVTIVAPSATLTGAATFPSEGVGSTSPANAFTYTNNGGVAITLAATPVTLTGGNASNFALVSSQCTAGLVLQPTNSCTFGVTFTPNATGTRTTTLTVTDAAGGATAQTLTLSGTGVAPSGTLAPSPVSFANQLVGSTSAAATVTFTNTTGAPITLRAGTSTNLGNANGPAVGINGNNPTNFAIVAGLGTTCTNGAVIATGGTCTISVTFDPNATGARTATLHVYAATATASFATDTLSGTGIQAAVTFSGSTAMTTGTANRNVKTAVTTITNSGTGPLVISSITIATNAGQTNPGTYSVANPGTLGTTACPIGGTGLAAGAFCQVTVTYTPPATGTLGTINGTLTVADTGASAATQTRNYTGN